MRRQRKRATDFILFLTVLILLSIGLVMVFSASVYFAGDPEGPFKDPFHFFKQQLFGAFLGLSAMYFMMNFSYWQLKHWVLPMLLLAFILLILVLIPGVGQERLGSTRWINFFGITSFQPSELVKIFLVIFIAHGLALKKDMIQNFTQGVLPFLLVVGAAGGLIMLQPDLGTTATLAGTVFVMIFIAGVQTKHLVAIFGAGVAFVTAAIIMAPYRMKRLTAFLDPESDPTGSGWNIINALMSIGSGGLWGTGLGQGRHSKFLFLPERHTDFIFAAIGEELGFIGGSIIILLFVLLAWRGFRIAITCPDTFGSLLAAGLTSSLVLQAFVNIGVVTGALPVTGITLPFVSFGSTSLIFSLLAVGIILNISRYITPK